MMGLLLDLYPFLIFLYFVGRMSTEKGWKKLDELMLLALTIAVIWRTVEPLIDREFGTRTASYDYQQPY